MEPCLLYARYSPRPEKAADKCPSIENQAERMRGYCDFARLEPVGEPITDPLTSARNVALADRPGGRKVLAALGYQLTECKCCKQLVIGPRRRAGISVLVAYSVDRMFRDLADGMGWLERWAEDGVAFHTAGGVLVDATTADGWLCSAIQVLMASYEPRKTSERTSHGMKARQSRNERMSAQPPYGWAIDPHSEPHPDSGLPTGLIPNPVELAAIERIKELSQLPKYRRADGSPQLSRIARQLDREHRPSRNGKWHHTTVRRILER